MAEQEDKQTVINKGLDFLLGESKLTTIIGGLIAILAGIVIFPESLSWINLSEAIASDVVGYSKFLLFILGLFFARIVQSEKKEDKNEK